MDVALFIISFISMIATVVSTVIAVKVKNESKEMLKTIHYINLGTQSIQNNNVKNKGEIDIKNSGKNEGIIAGILTGVITNNAKK